MLRAVQFSPRHQQPTCCSVTTHSGRRLPPLSYYKQQLCSESLSSLNSSDKEQDKTSPDFFLRELRSRTTAYEQVKAWTNEKKKFEVPFTTKWTKHAAEWLNFKLIKVTEDHEIFGKDLVPAADTDLVESALWLTRNLKGNLDNIEELDATINTSDPIPLSALDFIANMRRILKREANNLHPRRGLYKSMAVELLRATGFQRESLTALKTSTPAIVKELGGPTQIAVVSVPNVVVSREYPGEFMDPKATIRWETTGVFKFGQIAGDAFALGVMNRPKISPPKDDFVVDIIRLHGVCMNVSVTRAVFPPNFIEDVLNRKVPKPGATMHLLKDNSMTLRTEENRNKTLRILSTISNSYLK